MLKSIPRDEEQAEYIAGQAENRAKVALSHYFRLVNTAPPQLDGESHDEIHGIIDDVVDAAVARACAMIYKQGVLIQPAGSSIGEKPFVNLEPPLVTCLNCGYNLEATGTPKCPKCDGESTEATKGIPDPAGPGPVDMPMKQFHDEFVKMMGEKIHIPDKPEPSFLSQVVDDLVGDAPKKPVIAFDGKPRPTPQWVTDRVAEIADRVRNEIREEDGITDEMVQDFVDQLREATKDCTPLNIIDAPKKPVYSVRVTKTVVSDLPKEATADVVHVTPGAPYTGPDKVKINGHGAVAVMTSTGWLGLKPGEFVWESEPHPAWNKDGTCYVTGRDSVVCTDCVEKHGDPECWYPGPGDVPEADSEGLRPSDKYPLCWCDWCGVPVNCNREPLTLDACLGCRELVSRRLPGTIFPDMWTSRCSICGVKRDQNTRKDAPFADRLVSYLSSEAEHDPTGDAAGLLKELRSFGEMGVT